uniref:Reverse transcriptase Ty1/copia-type domain-containing protein n=1 Tax=Fagus sylvatica TaxID=28930 RepID=A0A2N9FDK4_FAGSY
MVVRSLDVKKDHFRPQEVGEETLGPKVPYLSAIGALKYLANCTRPDIAFSINLLARIFLCKVLMRQGNPKALKETQEYCTLIPLPLVLIPLGLSLARF